MGVFYDPENPNECVLDTSFVYRISVDDAIINTTITECQCALENNPDTKLDLRTCAISRFQQLSSKFASYFYNKDKDKLTNLCNQKLNEVNEKYNRSIDTGNLRALKSDLEIGDKYISKNFCNEDSSKYSVRSAFHITDSIEKRGAINYEIFEDWSFGICGAELDQIVDTHVANKLFKTGFKEGSNYLANITSSCVDFFKSNSKSRQELKAQITKVTNSEIKIVQKKEKERIRKLKAEKSKKERAQKNKVSRNKQFELMVKSEKNRVIWGALSEKKGEIYGAGNDNELFNMLNIEYQKQVKSKSGSSNSFIPPKKGEFEKTAAYKSRINKLKEEFEKNSLSKQNQAKSMDGRLFSSVLNSKFGTPEIRNLKYDADNEQFIVQVGNSKWSGVKGVLPMAIDKASNMKKELIKYKPWVVFSKKNEVLKTVGIILQSKKGNIKVANNVSSKIPIQFTIAQATEYKKIKRDLKIKKQAEQDAIRARELAEQKAKKARERAAWPKGSVAIISSGASLCTNIRSMYKADVIERSGNQYMPTPDGCVNLSSDKYAIEVKHIQGGFAKVLLVGASLRGYVSSRNIYE